MHDTPEELKYSSTHEWLRQEDDIVVLGITDHAQKLLGDIVFIELPEIGESIKAGDEIGVVESVKAASDFYTPISGEIVAINEELADAPSLINSDPYGDGWLVKIQLHDESELDELLSAHDYKDFLEEEEGE